MTDCKDLYCTVYTVYMFIYCIYVYYAPLSGLSVRDLIKRAAVVLTQIVLCFPSFTSYPLGNNYAYVPLT